MLFHSEFYLRLIVAALCGCVIGYERKRSLKQAGMRTHTIVAVGSCLIMILSLNAFGGIGDPARLAAQVVSGIGFIGAGMIMIRRNVVSGVATAAGIWTTSAVGLSIGSGMMDLGVFCTVLVLFVQVGVRLFGFDPGEGKQGNIRVTVDSFDEAQSMIDLIRSNGGHILEYSFEQNIDGRYNVSCDILITRKEHVKDIIGDYADRAHFRVIEP